MPAKACSSLPPSFPTHPAPPRAAAAAAAPPAAAAMVMRLCMAVACVAAILQGAGAAGCGAMGNGSTCVALIGYRAPNNLALRTIAALFRVRLEALLGANDLDLSLPTLPDVALPQGTLVRVPLPCSCLNATARVDSLAYTIQPGDTLSKIAGYFSNLLTYQQIAAANNITNPNLIYAGSSLLIPLHCACHGGAYHGLPASFLSYQAQRSDTLAALAASYAVPEADLQALNSISTPSDLLAGDVVDIPIPACTSSFKPGALDYGLVAARGSYVLTAGDCVQCSCLNGSTKVYCSQSPNFDMRSGSCAGVKCANSNLTVGEFNSAVGKGGCRVNSCVYEGFTNTTILTVLQNELDPNCPAALPPQSFYKPAEGVVASPLTGPEPGGSTQPVPPSGEAPSAGGSEPPSGASSVTEGRLPITSLLAVCFSLFICAYGW